MSYKKYNNFETFTAADANILMRQGIIPVASASERDAIEAPTEGMHVYRTDLDRIQRFDGATWINPFVTIQRATLNTGTYASTGNSGTTVYWGSVTVTFPTPFAETPLIAVDCSSSGAVATCNVLSASTTGFTFRAMRFATALGTLDYAWSAIGRPS